VSAAFLPQAAIRTKRDGGRLTDDELRAFARGAADGSIPDYQLSALLMAIFFRGLDDRELATWADAMLRSGDVLDLGGIPRPKVDKHSTGGVGDKISLPLAPAVAACGVAVPMVSGRGLGHTGGTLDKLESIPGFRVDLPVERFTAQVAELGVCLIGQTARIAPADRTLYALRDVTATVESIPLIASSIMSKKLAEGIDALVLDVKVGDGAFMGTAERAAELARAMQAIGRAAGKRVTAVLTRMDAPIGRTIGNALEVRETIETLRGGGPADTRELTIELGAEMLALGGVASGAAARARIAGALDDGSALALFREVVAAQGGDPRAVDEPERVLPRAPRATPVPAPAGGVVAGMRSRDLGTAALLLGAGRKKVADAIDPAAGIELTCHIGDAVERGAPLAMLHHGDVGADVLARATELVAGAYDLGRAAPVAGSRVIEVLR
jgi:pyrimidine-nucleoside phosphorylase